jgi:AcrR family transcriptional regulator
MTIASPPKPPRLMARKRELVRETILLAAQGLLERPERTDFSMRELAEAAGVSFVTPFKHFGSKDGLLGALMFRRFQEVEAHYKTQPPGGDALDRVLFMARLGADVMLAQASVTRAMAIGIGAGESRELIRGARNLWALALGDLDGLDTTWSKDAASLLPEQLAVLFRGALVMWVGGDLSDEQFPAIVETCVASHLAAYCHPEQKAALARIIARHHALASFD